MAHVQLLSIERELAAVIRPLGLQLITQFAFTRVLRPDIQASEGYLLIVSLGNLWFCRKTREV